MRNPDPWLPPEPDERPGLHSRRAALIGLLIIVLLLGSGFFLSRILRTESRFEDCSISGRANCADGGRP